MADTIVEEVRSVRDAYAREFNYDLHAMCADLRREQEQSGDKVVSLPRRPVRFKQSDEELEHGLSHSRR